MVQTLYKVIETNLCPTPGLNPIRRDCGVFTSELSAQQRKDQLSKTNFSLSLTYSVEEVKAYL